jgi:hypothetical protein
MVSPTDDPKKRKISYLQISHPINVRARCPGVHKSDDVVSDDILA